MKQLLKNFKRSLMESVGYEMQFQAPKSRFVRAWIWVSCAWCEVKCCLAYAWCLRFGHKIYDDSSAGPNSGNMDHGCSRCGMRWNVLLY